MTQKDQFPYRLRQAVIDEIDRQFNADQARTVRDKLANSRLPSGHAAVVPRAHLAILRLSNGDLAEFERQVDQALCDWRDLLVNAGLADEDWRDVLAGDGIDARDW